MQKERKQNEETGCGRKQRATHHGNKIKKSMYRRFICGKTYAMRASTPNIQKHMLRWHKP